MTDFIDQYQQTDIVPLAVIASEPTTEKMSSLGEPSTAPQPEWAGGEDCTDLSTSGFVEVAGPQTATSMTAIAPQFIPFGASSKSQKEQGSGMKNDCAHQIVSASLVKRAGKGKSASSLNNGPIVSCTTELLKEMLTVYTLGDGDALSLMARLGSLEQADIQIIINQWNGLDNGMRRILVLYCLHQEIDSITSFDPRGY